MIERCTSRDEEALRTDTLTLQTILQLGYAAYERHHRLPDYVRRAVWAILACRTALLGGHVETCPERHVERVWYNSCRHRMCPPAGAVRVRGWGLYGHTQGDALARCRQQVGQRPVEAPAVVDGQDEGAGWGEEYRERCPVCGQQLVCVALVPRAGAPPPAAAVSKQVA